MKTLIENLSDVFAKAFESAGYDTEYAKVVFSNRPDLCQFQCNGAMALAKKYHKAPIQIANDVLGALESNMVCDVSAVNPGFLNFNVSPEYLSQYVEDMSNTFLFGIEEEKEPQTIIIDYGGPNVAKPLHVGHLRSAIIGESVKRICRFMGGPDTKVIGDIHLGDFGLQMGLIITELKERQPELVYFDDSYTGEYPEEAPFTISELEEIYPTASEKSKKDEGYKARAMEATYKLQNSVRGYKALWQHIIDVSVADLKKNYERLDVDFDLWWGESSVQDEIPDMVGKMKKDGFAYESDGAFVVDVGEETDTKEVPPCIIVKSDGASLYSTTDLATLLKRQKEYAPDKVIYVVDKRQEMHFTQVFRCAKKTGCIDEDTELKFLGFGTMNGRDGKPFKTREGGVMRLENLLDDINEEMYKKIITNKFRKAASGHGMDDEEARETSKIVALAAIKYGDLSNQATKDYVFDVDKFTSFEGNTGPYILYTIVRLKSILKKYVESGSNEDIKKFIQGGPKYIGMCSAASVSETNLMLELTKLQDAVVSAYEELAPHKICAFIYDVANAFNSFYHENNILAEEDEKRQGSYIALLKLTKKVLEMCICLLGFDAPDHM